MVVINVDVVELLLVFQNGNQSFCSIVVNFVIGKLQFLKASTFINEFTNSFATFGGNFIVGKTQNIQTLFSLLDHSLDNYGHTFISDIVSTQVKFFNSFT